MDTAVRQQTNVPFNAQVFHNILRGKETKFNLNHSSEKKTLVLPEIPETLSFPLLEHEVLKYWKEISAFDSHLSTRKQQQTSRKNALDGTEKCLTELRAAILDGHLNVDTIAEQLGYISSIPSDFEEAGSFTMPAEVKEKFISSIDALQKKLVMIRESNAYVFYEGPPFATGLPHYGHLLAATIKDVVCRYYSNVNIQGYTKNICASKGMDLDADIETAMRDIRLTDSHWRPLVEYLKEANAKLKNLPDGFHIERVAGWDCHGLPIEFEIEKELGIKTKAEVEKFGIARYNEHCRAIVLRYREEWQKVVGRIGRWLDFDPGKEYKTMNTDYMESVWHIFQMLYKKNLIYCGFKVMPFSIGCGTPLSNFEANLNYKEINDISILVGFPVLIQNTDFSHDVTLVAWTTTPWTLPANYALVVNPDMEYVVVRREKSEVIDHFIVAESRYDFFLSMMKQKAKGDDTQPAWCIQRNVLGRDLAGLRYSPPFSTLKDEMDRGFVSTQETSTHRKGFVVLSDNYVSSTAGTGVVHCAPCFGEDDYRVCTESGLISVNDGEKSRTTMNLLPYLCPVDENGFFTGAIGNDELQQKHIKEKETEGVLLTKLKGNNRLLAKGTVVHSYPFCWRSEVPLIYKAVSSWFVNINAVRERMVQLVSEQSHWVPSHVCEKRFINWIKGVASDDDENSESKGKGKDWAISRSRFWGTPLPIWKSEDEKSIVVIGSVEQLQEKAFVPRRNLDACDSSEDLVSLKNIPINDLHRHHIDCFVIPDPRGDEYPPLKRVPEVFDCWFESGCMPYAHRHFPFNYGGDGKSAEEKFLSDHFPANFIAEGLDQTRGWFYTLLVLGTACFDAIPFKNVIVNGLVLAGDGRKMSKKLKNYPDPSEVIEKYGADALRMYFMNSSVVRGEPMRFNIEGVREIVKEILIPLVNALKFFVQNVNRNLRCSTESDACADMPNLHPLEVLRAYYVAVSSADANIPNVNTNIMDQWIVSETQSLLSHIHAEMANYHLFAIPGKLYAFLPLLTNFYVRMNRSRMKGREGVQEQLYSLMSLLYVLYNFIVLLSPFAPFFADFAYAVIRPLLPERLQHESVHFSILPSPNSQLKNPALEATFANMRQAIEGIRTLRDQQKIPLKTPLQSVIIAHPSGDVCREMQRDEIARYMTEEMNVLSIMCANVYDMCSVELQPNLPVLGRKMKGKLKDIVAELKSLPQPIILDWVRLVDKDSNVSPVLRLEKAGVDLTSGDINVLYTFNQHSSDSSFSGAHGAKKEDFRSIQVGSFILFLNVNYKDNDELQKRTLYRYFISHVQQLRKKHNFHASDKIAIYYSISTDGEGFSLEKAHSGVESISLNELQVRHRLQTLEDRSKWINSSLREGLEEIECKLNSKIISETNSSAKMSESLPFFEEGIILTMAFY